MVNGRPAARAQECHWASRQRSPQTIYRKHKSTDNLSEAQVFTMHLSTPTKASEASYFLLIGILAWGEMVGDNWRIGGQVFPSLNLHTRA